MSEYQYPAETLDKAYKNLQENGGPAQQNCGNSLKDSDYAKSLGSKATGGLTNQTGIAWGGTYPPPPEQHVCPHCGYCPHCGRGGGYVPNYPHPYYYPIQPWPGYPNPYVGDLHGWQNWNTVT